MDLLLAGWRIRLLCAPEALAEAVAARYGAFAVPEDGPADLTIQVAAGPGPWREAPPPGLLAAALEPEPGGYRLATAGATARIQLEEGLASLVLTAGDPLGGVEYFLRIACALLAFRDGGLMLHAAGLVVAGRAHLFIGVSGSGKSTVTALSPHATALSDDLVLLRPASGCWIAYGTPFWNPETAARAGQTATGRVAGIYKLVKASEVRLEPFSAASAAAELAANCPVVNGRPELLSELLLRCRALVGAVPAHRLYFRKDASFWRVIEGGAS